MTVRTARVGDLELAYETFGSPEDPAVLLVMGLGTQMLGWARGFCEELAEAGRHVIRFDNRDIGLSSHLDSAGVPDLLALLTGNANPAYLIEDMAVDAIGLLDALAIPRAHIVGASMGGMIAQAIAIGFPDRVLSLTSIMSTPGNRRGRARPTAQAVLMRPAPTSPDAAADEAMAVFGIIGSPGFPMDVDRLRAEARESYRRNHDPAGSTRQFAAILASPDRTAGLAKVTAPTLVIHGEDDPLITLDGGIATAAAVPGARLISIPGMGHDLPEELWPQFVEAIVALGEAREVEAGQVDAEQ